MSPFDIRYQPVVRFFSAVGGGPHMRVVKALQKRGLSAENVELFSPQQWRACFAKGKLGRLAARGLSFGAYPLLALFHACRMSASNTVGHPTQKPLLVATTNPFFLPHFLLATKPLHRCGVVALMYDIYPDALEALGLSHPLLSAVMGVANRYLFKHADAVVHIGNVLKSNAESRYGKNPHTYLIQTGGARCEFTNKNHALPDELTAWMRDRTIFSYVGNMGLMHDVETLAAAVPQCLDSLSPEARAQIGFIFAASGPGVETLRAAWGEKYDDAIRFLPPLPDDAWADLLMDTDVALATLSAQAHAVSLPSKIQSSIAADCVALAVAPNDSDLAQIIAAGPTLDDPDHPLGCVVEPGDAERLSQYMQQLCDAAQRQRFLPNVQNAAAYLDVDHLSEIWAKCFDDIVAEAPTPWSTASYHAIKRAVDACAAAAGLAVLSPLLLAVAAAVRIKLGSPVLFKQTRLGIHAKPFTLCKFRSMKNAPAATDATHDAERLSAFGKKLRALSLDELPTLFNVLKGDMSLVGPRPLLPQYKDRYSDQQAQRQWCKPGITGLAQVNGRNALDWDEKFRFDVDYVHHASLRTDLAILFKTVSAVLGKKGIAHADNATMPEFMGK